MQIDTKNEKICINKLVESKNEVLTVESDLVIPDVKPDIIASISTCGNICIYKKEILDGKVRIDGCVDTYIMYLADSEENTVRGINTSIDFTHIMEIEKCNSNMNLELDTNLKNINCNVINGRKIGIKVEIGIEVRVFENRDEEVINSVVDIENIQKQNKTIKINSLVGSGVANVIAKDALTIEEGQNLGEILKANCEIKNKEYKTSYNKILAKADFCIKIMYLTEDNSIKTKQAQIPIMGFIDIPNIYDDNICDINYLVKNISIKPSNLESNIINVEAEIQSEARAYDVKEIEIIDDIYSPEYDIKFSTKEIETISEKNKYCRNTFLNENINIEEIGVKNILDIETSQEISNINVLNEKIIYEGELNLKIFFKSNNVARIEIKQLKIPFNYEIANVANLNNMNINTKLEITNESYNINGNNLEIKNEMKVELDLFRIIKIKIIESIELEEYEKKNCNGMTIYFVKQGDSMWNIAKKFRTTIMEICTSNEIDENSILKPGQQLCITNFNKKREKLA